MPTESTIKARSTEPRALSPLVVPRDTCIDYTRSSKLEWLETNGTGGFAMGTVAGANTRRYHGLLVGSLRPPVDRYVLLAKVDETVVVDGREAALGSNQYPGTVHPEGFQHLVEFRLDPFPTWVFSVGETRIEKRLFLVNGEQTAVVKYRASQPCRLRVQPFLAFRDYHSLTRSNSVLNGAVREETGHLCRTLRIQPYAVLPELRLHFNGAHFEQNGGWYYNTEYLEELERGLDFQEDLYCMGTLTFELCPEKDAWVVATLDESRQVDPASVERLETAERARRRSTWRDPFASRLSAAADQFLVRRADKTPTVIAGYPWFTDWGRDTMIALPGLLIARGRLEEARQVIQGFLRHIDKGIIPNRFPDRGEQPEYNTADATLWMFQAVHSYLEAGGDVAFVRDEFYPAAKKILLWHHRGTHHAIAVDEKDLLLIAGDEGTQLTWMDAKINGQVITPRHGKPVEVNALYYNALRLMAQWAKKFGEAEQATAYEQDAAVVNASFADAFWNEGRGCLYDVITPKGPDPSLRPNQLFAVSLPFPLLTATQCRSVVRVVEAKLLTPVGLRTLAPGEPGYRPHYRGGPVERDGAYHQGVVWPWLLGPFIRAYLRAFGRTPETLAYCRGLVRGLEEHLSQACMGTISEIFEAEPPFRPVGAPAQAWSVAELFQVLTAELSESDETLKPRPVMVPARPTIQIGRR